MPYSAASNLDLYCLPVYPFRGIQSSMGMLGKISADDILNFFPPRK